jgi:hypothetical protein
MFEKQVYDVDYFIRKFEAIPEELWCIGQYTDGEGRYCALGWCRRSGDENGYAEEVALERISPFFVPDVNDGHDERYQQPTPKQRVLAALRDIKETK